MKTNNVVSKKIQIKIDNISFLQKQLKDYDFLSEEDVLILLKNFEKTTKYEMSIHFERYFQDDVFASILLKIANQYRENKKIQICVITSLGNMINRYSLKETEEIYHYFKSQMFSKGISAYVSIHLPYFKSFQKEENKWDYFMKVAKMSPKKIAEANFLAIVSKYSREIPTEYKAQVIDFLTEKQEKANHKSGKKYFQELINDILNSDMRKYADIKDIIEYGLNSISDKEKITMSLKDFLYIRRVLEEYMRYLHNPDHYPDIEAIQNFLGDISSGGGFECLSTAIYEKVYKVDLPSKIEKMIDDGVFEHPLYPSYYKKNE